MIKKTLMLYTYEAPYCPNSASVLGSSHTRPCVETCVGLSHVPADMGTLSPKVVQVHVLHSWVKLKEVQLTSLSAAKAWARHQQKYKSTSNFTNKTI